jgi:hypothetical protein
MITRSRLTTLAAIGLVGILTLARVPLASSQGLTLSAAYVPGSLTAGAIDSPMWTEAAPVPVPLSAQQVALPQLTGASIQSVNVRALHNGSQLALLLEWADDTQDSQMIRVQDFRDAVAVQFPLVEGPPFFCMGQAGGDVNIWHWKADWQADITARQDMETIYPDMHVDSYPFADPSLGLLAGPADYTDPNYLPALAAGNLFAIGSRSSPVEDLVAGGFGTMTSQTAEEQNVQGFGSWADGLWQVIFLRELASPESHDVVFSPSRVYPLAFAVWDGSNGERDGRKSTSQWISLQFEKPPAPTAPEARPTSPATNREPFIFVIAPMAATLALIGLGVGGLYVLGSLMARRR